MCWTQQFHQYVVQKREYTNQGVWGCGIEKHGSGCVG